MWNVTKVLLALTAIVLCGLPLVSLLKRSEPPAPIPADVAPDLEDQGMTVDALPQSPTMSSAQFSQLQSGMSYGQCVQVIGVEGESVAPPNARNAGITQAYRWLDVEGTNEYVIGFRDGRLASKSMDRTQAERAQARARRAAVKAQTFTVDRAEVARQEQAARSAGQSVVIAVEEFDRINVGMTYDECVAIIGAENPMARGYAGQRRAVLSGQAGSNTLSEGYTWPNAGSIYAEIAFENGRMTQKTWKAGPDGRPAARVSGGSGRNQR
jgi:hypothetical protein